MIVMRIVIGHCYAFLFFCFLLVGVETESELQLTTSVFIEDTKTPEILDNLEGLVGKTIVDAKYHLWCKSNLTKVLPSTPEKPFKSICENKTGIFTLRWEPAYNPTDVNEKRSKSVLQPNSVGMETYLRNLFEGEECSNTTIPVCHRELQESLATLIWDTEHVFDLTNVSFVTEISPETVRDRQTIAITDVRADLLITVDDPSLNSTNGVAWKLPKPNVTLKPLKSCIDNDCSKDLEQNGRIGYFNGTSLDISSLLITGSYWRCEIRVKFYLRNQDVALILNVIQDQHVWTHRLTTLNKWREQTVPIGSIDGNFYVKLQMYRNVNPAWKEGELQSAMFQNCHLPQEQLAKPLPGRSNDTFICMTGVTISSHQLCDFHNDCFHGDDESEEICGSEYSTELCDFESTDLEDCSFLDSDSSYSFLKPRVAKMSPALTDSNGSLNGHILAYEEHESLRQVQLTSVILTNYQGYSVDNKSCELQLYAYLSEVTEREEGPFNLRVLVTEALTKATIYRNDTSLTKNGWRRYRVRLPDFSKRNFTLFYITVSTELSKGEFLGFDKIFFTPECKFTDQKETFPREDLNENNVVVIVTMSCASAAVVWTTALVLIYRRYTKIPKSGKAIRGPFSSCSRSLACVPDSAPLLRRLNDNLCQDHPNFHMYKQILTQDLNEDIKNLSRYKLKLTKVLGSGAFGEVLQGQLIKGAIFKHVAVKRLSSGCSEREKLDFLVEALTMSKFKHDNIVCCLGIYVKNGCLLLVEELMAGGDLKRFLVESHPSTDEATTLSTNELLSLANDICQACRYLERNKFIHRDIASRNCLLTTKTPDRVVKMADFGLARDIMQNDLYKKCGRSMLPVRWLPPESYLEGVFTTKSDVWAYGVLLWEIFSFGCVPYPSMKCDEMMGKVNEGQRMEAPARCPPAVYDVMMLCWHKDPESRPSFQRLCEYIEKIRKNVCIIIDGRGDVSNDDDDNDSINKLPVWHYNGNYAIEEDSV